MKSAAQAWESQGHGGKGKEGKFISVLLLLGQSAGPCIKKTTSFEMSQ